METASRFADLDGVRARHGAALVDTIVAGCFTGDPAADALVDAFAAYPPGERWRMLDRALTEGPDAVRDAPAELARVVLPALEPPSWIDLDLVDAGAVAWWRVGALTQLMVLTAGSLAYGYGSASLARPLAITGRLTRKAPRRLGETTRWVMAATRPGALRPGAEGHVATVRLRMVHALVRRSLRPRWDVASWGEPLSAADTVATGSVGFFVHPHAALRDLGVRHSPAELEAINHLWAWIDLLMGAPEDLVPRTAADAVAWADAARELDGGGIPESPDLLDALLFHGLRFDRALPGPASAAARLAAGHALGAMARRWMGDERADTLRAPDTPLKHLVPALRPLAHVRELARATGVLGSDASLVAREIALVERTLALVGTVRESLRPEDVEPDAEAAGPVARAA